MGREKSYERREQIVEAALDLLADTSLEDLTTRQIARHIGVSQPALFRHFRTRDGILEAVVDRMRERLSAAVVELFGEAPSPLERARGLVRILFEHAQRHPGLVRLVLAEAVSDERASYGASLDHLVSMQRAFFVTLVRKAKEHGEIATSVDPDVAATLALALLQGTLLGWMRGGRTEPLAPWARRVSSCWEAGLLREERDVDVPPARPASSRSLRLAALDVRPIIAAGADPLDAILAMLDRLGPDGLAVVIVPFRPMPLLALLKEDGYRTELEELDGGRFELTIFGAAAPPLIDLSELEAPLPLERVLTAAATLEPGLAVHFRVPRVPRLLLPRLAERNVSCEVHEQIDARALLSIWRSP